VSPTDLCLALALSAALAIVVAATLGCSSSTARMWATRVRLYRGAWAAFWRHRGRTVGLAGEGQRVDRRDRRAVMPTYIIKPSRDEDF
jgi:hypothetical protein